MYCDEVLIIWTKAKSRQLPPPLWSQMKSQTWARRWWASGEMKIQENYFPRVSTRHTRKVVWCQQLRRLWIERSWWKNFLISKYNKRNGKHTMFTHAISSLSFIFHLRLSVESFNYLFHLIPLTSLRLLFIIIPSLRRGMSHYGGSTVSTTQGRRKMLEFNFLFLIFLFQTLPLLLGKITLKIFNFHFHLKIFFIIPLHSQLCCP